MSDFIVVKLTFMLCGNAVCVFMNYVHSLAKCVDTSAQFYHNYVGLV